MKKRRLKSILAFLLVFCMVFSVQANIVFAQENDDSVVQKSSSDAVTDTENDTDVTDTESDTGDTDVTDTENDTGDTTTTEKGGITTETEKGSSKLKRSIAPTNTEEDSDDEISPQSNDDTIAGTISNAGGSLGAGTYTLSTDVSLSTDLTIPANTEVTIDLNGHTLTGSGNDSVITVYGTLTVQDSGTAGEITGGKGPSTDSEQRTAGGGGIYVAEDAVLTFAGGNITGNESSHGGGICVHGTLYMTGGKITKNKATYGGGIYSNSATTGTIVMSGGEISENEANYGGGVRAGGVSFTMSDGTISNNKITGTNGQGAGVQAFRAFTMSGGTISGNTGASMGGGVFVQVNIGNFTMQGGTVSGNTATSTGGGVYTAGTFTMSDGTISGNNANDGGGVYCIGGEMVMSGGSITGNTASNNGGGVRAGGASFTMKNGTISNNKATNGQGGGIWISKPMTMENGQITENSAKTLGGGIFINGNTTATVKGGTISKNNVTADKGGGGVYFAYSGALHVSGNPVITNNTANSNTEQNVLLLDSRYITLDGDLTDGAEIGITPGNANLPNINRSLQITTAESGTNYYTTSYKYFTADVLTRQLGTDKCVVVSQKDSAKNYVELAIYVSRTITFNSNDGTSAQTKEQIIPKDTETTLDANTFIRSGYAFTGWSTSQDGVSGTNYADKAQITISNDLTLYAQWKEKEESTISITKNLDKTYNGKEVSISANDYTVTGTDRTVTFSYQVKEGNDWKDLDSAPTNVGTYQVKAVVEENDTYKSAESAWKEFTISKATPDYTIPTGLTATVGQTLANVKLPTGFTWQDADSTSVGTAGTHTFKATYTPTDTENYNIVKDIEVTVKVYLEAEIINVAPTITAEDKVLTVGDTFKPLEGVTASDKEDGDLTSKITVESNTVDTSTVGTYTVTYKVKDNGGASCTKTIYVTVNPKMETLNEVPVINAENKTLTVGDTFDAKADVTATDTEDGDITKNIEVISNTVDTSKAGTYEVTYKVTDSQGASVTKTITVTVKEKDVQKPTTDDNKKPSKTDTDKKPANTDKTTSNSPKTGDNTNMTLWGVLVILSGGLLAVVAGMRRKRKFEK